MAPDVPPQNLSFFVHVPLAGANEKTNCGFLLTPIRFRGLGSAVVCYGSFDLKTYRSDFKMRDCVPFI
jgi:hypothetical protein